MATYFTLITAVGQSKLAVAIASGTSLGLTYMAVGDGNGNPVTPAEGMTALVNETYRAQITNLEQDPDNTNRFISELVIPATTGGFTIREAGVFDTTGALIAIANFPSTYKPVVSDGSTREMVVRIVMEVSDTASVTLSVDASVVMASQKWVLDNFSVAKLLAGGTTGQVLRKKSSTSGDVEWGSPASASETVQGVVELATTAEATAGTDTARAVTPAGLAAAVGALVPAASETVQGKVELATTAEAVAGTDTSRAVTPAGVAAAVGGSIDVVRGWTKQQYPAQVSRTGQSGAQAVDCDLHAALAITATGALTMSNPEHMGAEKFVTLRFYSASAQTISWGTAWLANSTTALPTVTVAGKWLTCSFWCSGTAMVLMGKIQEA